MKPSHACPWQLLFLVGGIVAVALSIGCGKPAHIPDLGEVSGTVTLDSKPLANATVTFAPTAGRPSAGTTNAAGQYSLSFVGDYTGAMVGSHTVRISTEQYIEREDGTTDYVKESIPPVYNKKSTLSASVKPGENTFDFELSSKPGKHR